MPLPSTNVEEFNLIFINDILMAAEFQKAVILLSLVITLNFQVAIYLFLMNQSAFSQKALP